jgi:hypothetical protein
MYRAWERLPAEAREQLTRGLSASELRTVLLQIARARAAAVTPADLVRRWRDDPLVRPADQDPRRTAILEADLWRLLPTDVSGVDLSPVAPLGTCAAIAPGSQDRIVTTTRGSEVVSDPTNALAVEAAVRRADGPAGAEVHLAACVPVLRAQPFGAGMSQHFRLFALVSSARDTGSRPTESRLLGRHVRHWQSVLGAVAAEAGPRIELTVFDDQAMADRLHDVLEEARADHRVPVSVVPDRQHGRGYYTRAALRIVLENGEVEVGDGGLTGWTAALTADAKERCMVSVLATQRVAAAAVRDPPARLSAEA